MVMNNTAVSAVNIVTSHSLLLMIFRTSYSIVTKKHRGKLNLKSQPELGSELKILLSLLP